MNIAQVPRAAIEPSGFSPEVAINYSGKRKREK